MLPTLEPKKAGPWNFDLFRSSPFHHQPSTKKITNEISTTLFLYQEKENNNRISLEGLWDSTSESAKKGSFSCKDPAVTNKFRSSIRAEGKRERETGRREQGGYPSRVAQKATGGSVCGQSGRTFPSACVNISPPSSTFRFHLLHSFYTATDKIGRRPARDRWDSRFALHESRDPFQLADKKRGRFFSIYFKSNLSYVQ